MTPSPETTSQERLRACFCEALALPAGADIDAMAYRTHPSWDSVGHMRLIAAMETRFGIMLTTDDILSISDFPKACAVLAQHGVIENA